MGRGFSSTCVYTVQAVVEKKMRALYRAKAGIYVRVSHIVY